VIDQVADETARMLDEYRTLTRRIDSLTTYNRQMERVVNAQDREIASINRQLGQLENTNQEVVPLMLRMVEALDSFVQLDVPFLPNERRERIVELREMMDRADVTNSEKYRRVLEAYQIEMDYGRNSEAYQGELAMNGQSRTVDFLRFGRVGLYYSTLDGEEVGLWNPETRQWMRLGNEYRTAVRDGLRIARRQAAPNLLTLPIQAPERLP
jgi:hypothetical protein